MVTLEEIFTMANSSVTFINSINTEGLDSEYAPDGATQEQINEMIQRNVDHLQIILAYNGLHGKPDVAGSSEDKSSYTDAIATGNAYIAAN
tara:strand:+ start:1910 stop:2182 length:273 start_codon:yes stop_codon:yes gene_type:complete